MKKQIISIIIGLFVLAIVVTFFIFVYREMDSHTVNTYELSELEDNVYAYCNDIVVCDKITICVNDIVREYSGDVEIIYTDEEKPTAKVICYPHKSNADGVYLYVPKGSVVYGNNTKK